MSFKGGVAVVGWLSFFPNLMPQIENKYGGFGGGCLSAVIVKILDECIWFVRS